MVSYVPRYGIALVQLYLVFLGHASRGVMSEGGGGKQAGLFRQLSRLIE